ncbi:MAG TPA: hypothetical protein ENN75_03645 [candidate division Zixibacteria bacterium]|nr:hypothetical protein [candidate division Zixibacteria bacterium]
MKRTILLFCLAFISNILATVTIEGYVEVCERCQYYATCGEIRAYSRETGGTVIDYCCISPNGFFTLEVSENDTVWIEVYYAKHNFILPPGSLCARYSEWKSSERIQVITGTSDIELDVCADDWEDVPSTGYHCGC